MMWKFPVTGTAPSKIEEISYEIIAQELSSGSVKQGLWAKALADATWDESLAKSSYVKMRHEQLMNEFKLAEKEIKPSRSEEVLNRNHLAQEEARNYGLSEDEIRYLGRPIRAFDYLRKYKVSEDKLARACATKKITSVMHENCLWVSDIKI